MNKITALVNKLTYPLFIIYLYAFGIALPLFFHDHYFDMMEAKAFFNEGIIILLIIPLLLLSIYKLFTNRKYNILTILILLFSLFCTISTTLARDINNAFFGHEGWHIGLLVIITISLAIISFRDIRIKDERIFIPILISIGLINLIAIFHSFEIDIFNMHDNILLVSYHKFITTIGNINWYTGYLCLVVPLSCCLYVLCNKYQYYYLILAAISVMAVSLLGADGIYLGLGFVSFFIIPIIFKSKETLKRFAILILFFVLGLFIARQLMYCMDGYSGELRRMLVILPTLMLGIGLLLLSIFIKEDTYNSISKYLIIAIESLLIIAVITFTAINLYRGSFEWTTGRLSLWNDSLKLFINFKPQEKIFGIGLENLYLIYGPISERYQAIYLSAHSEWIQLLLTGGYACFISYLLCWLYNFFLYFKKKIYANKKLTPICMSLICYFGQTFINSATVCNVMMLSVFLIIYLQYLND